MIYKSLFDIGDGLRKDYLKITDAIDTLDKKVTEADEEFGENRVSIGRTGMAMHYTLYNGDYETKGLIDYQTIYNEFQGKDEFYYENILCELIEKDAIIKYFSS